MTDTAVNAEETFTPHFPRPSGEAAVVRTPAQGSTDITGDSQPTQSEGDTPTQAPAEASEAAEPAEGAQPEGEQPQVDAQQVDLESLGDHLVTVKINGEESQIPLREAVSGYMRQEAFTRKTQALAEQAKQVQQWSALAQALERDPASTVEALIDAYQLDFGGADDGDDVDAPEPDPVQEKLSVIEQELNTRKLAEAEARIQSEVDQLKAKHGEFDVQEVVGIALQRPGMSLTDAFAVMQFENAQSASQMRTTQVTDQKRQAQAVSGGSATQKGTVSKPKQFNNAREAIVAALRDQGVEL